jgi:hypothetical protein
MNASACDKLLGLLILKDIEYDRQDKRYEVDKRKGAIGICGHCGPTKELVRLSIPGTHLGRPG